jgi:hypothetical protein
MAIPHAVVLTAALLAMLCLPCAVALLLWSDEIAVRRSWSRRDPQALRLLRILDGVLGGKTGGKVVKNPVHTGGLESGEADPLQGATPPTTRAADVPALRLPGSGPMPGVDQITAELRRLDRQRRHGLATESTVWLAAVLFAYDAWLSVACRVLGVPERLEPLEGIDRELERVRVEDALRANGMVFR